MQKNATHQNAENQSSAVAPEKSKLFDQGVVRRALGPAQIYYPGGSDSSRHQQTVRRSMWQLYGDVQRARQLPVNKNLSHNGSI